MADRQAKIDQFKAITSIDSDDIATTVLEASGWNLDVGISQFYENPNTLLGNPSNNERNENNNGNNNANNRNGNNINNTNTGNNRGNNANNTNNHGTGGGAGGGTGAGGNWLIAKICWGLCSIFPLVFSFLGHFLGFVFGFAGASSISYNDLYNQFIAQYGNNFSFFKNMGFAQVMRESMIASTNQECSKNRAIFVYFYQNDNNSCDRHIRNILSNQAVIDYIRLNYDCWLGNTGNGQVRQLLAQVTRDWQDRRLPFVFIGGVHPNSGRLTIIHRQYVGQLNANQFLANILDVGLQRWDAIKLTLYNERIEQNQARMVRQEQDYEYERLLQQERMKQDETRSTQGSSHSLESLQSLKSVQSVESVSNDIESKEINERAIESEEHEKMQKIIKERSENAKSKLPNEPTSDESDENRIVKIALRLPSGTRLQRNFLQKDTVQLLYYWVECHPEAFKVENEFVEKWEIRSNYPRKAFLNRQQTLEQAGINTNIALFVEPCFEEDDE